MVISFYIVDIQAKFTNILIVVITKYLDTDYAQIINPYLIIAETITKLHVNQTLDFQKKTIKIKNRNSVLPKRMIKRPVPANIGTWDIEYQVND